MTDKTKEELIEEISSLKAEIEKQAHLQKESEDSEREMRTWLDNSPVCTKIVDLDLKLRFISHVGAASIKSTSEKLEGTPYPFDFYPEAFKDTMTGNLKKAIETGEVVVQEDPVLDAEGNEVWFHSTIIPVKDVEGAVEYLMVVSVDTTASHRAAELMMQKNEELEVIVKAATDRELKMIELKERIAELEARLGAQIHSDVGAGFIPALNRSTDDRLRTTATKSMAHGAWSMACVIPAEAGINSIKLLLFDPRFRGDDMTSVMKK